MITATTFRRWCHGLSSTESNSIPGIRPLQRLAPTQTLILLLPALLANRRIVVVEGMIVALLHGVLAVDAVREPLVLLAQADVLALADLKRVGKVFVVVAAGQEVVDLDAHVDLEYQEVGSIWILFLF